ncbi:hypothetical protein Tco_1445170, partial [Tanacetum coccineum]
MSDKKDEINKKNEKDWSNVERTQDLVEYVYDKYGNTTITDEMLDDLYNFAMMKDDKGKVDDLQNRLSKLEVDLAEHDKGKAKLAEHDKGKAKQAEHDLDDVDLDHVDLDGLDL